MSALAVVPMIPVTLREHVAELDMLLRSLEQIGDTELDGELRAEIERDLVASLAGTREKVDRVNGALAALDAAEAAAAAEIERLQARKKRTATMRARLEGYVIGVIEASNLVKLEGRTSTLAVRANPASVCIEDGVELPAEFLRYPEPPPPAPDKTAIKRALTTGREVFGCCLVHTLRLVRS